MPNFKIGNVSLLVLNRHFNSQISQRGFVLIDVQLSHLFMELMILADVSLTVLQILGLITRLEDVLVCVQALLTHMVIIAHGIVSTHVPQNQ